jgi:GNAT superfamily N-acetyltransferase
MPPHADLIEGVSMDLHLRAATDVDVPALACMKLRLVQDEHHRNPMGEPQLRVRMAEWLRDGWGVDLLVAGEAVVGYAVHRVLQDEYYPDRQYVYVRQFYVEREWRRQGIGRAGFGLLRDERFPDGAYIVLEVLTANPDGAAFWADLGFESYCTTLVLGANSRR